MKGFYNINTKNGKIRSALLGAVIGDIAGSRFEFNNYMDDSLYHMKIYIYSSY